MPLQTGKSKKVIQANIAKLISEGYQPRQATAIAYHNAGMSKNKKKKLA